MKQTFTKTFFYCIFCGHTGKLYCWVCGVCIVLYAFRLFEIKPCLFLAESHFIIKWLKIKWIKMNYQPFVNSASLRFSCKCMRNIYVWSNSVLHPCRTAGKGHKWNWLKKSRGHKWMRLRLNLYRNWHENFIVQHLDLLTYMYFLLFYF